MNKNKLFAALALVAVLGTAFAPTFAVAQAEPLTAHIDAPANNATFEVGQSISFVSSATGGQPPYVYVWNFGDGDQFGAQNTSHSYSQAGTYTVLMTVTDFASGHSTTQITLTIGEDDGGDALTITNVRVTDITSNSVVVRWTTNQPATSRVIYDTTSHSTLGEAPNYGYANSTGTDASEVTEHAVTVSGLAPSTTYYFRAISQ